MTHGPIHLDARDERDLRDVRLAFARQRVHIREMRSASALVAGRMLPSSPTTYIGPSGPNVILLVLDCMTILLTAWRRECRPTLW